MTLRLATGEIRVSFAMPLPVAQIAMFAGRALPVPPSMFSANLAGWGDVDVPLEVSRVEVVSAAEGTATLVLAVRIGFSRAGLPHDDLDVTLRPTVQIR